MNIFIEASIGVGKSSLIKNLELKFKDWKMSSAFFKEPVELWEETKAGNLLLQFSKDPKKYAFATQTHIMTTMYQQRIPQMNADINIYERSFLSAKYVFQAALQKEGYLNEFECLILDNLHDTLVRNMPVPDKILYLKVRPGVAYERTKMRNGPSDKSLTMNYFELLNQKHEEMIASVIESGKDVYVVNAEVEEQALAKDVAEWIEKEVNSIKD